MPRGSSARLFAALDPPSDVAERLAEWTRQATRAGAGRGAASGQRVLGPHLLHLTLCFLGERPVHEIGMLASALSSGCEGQRACELQLAAPVWLPPRRPRALAIEVRDVTGRLARLQRAVAGALAGVTGEAETSSKRFRPHITVARLRGEPARPDPVLIATPALDFLAEEVVLYRSHLEPAGARYEPIATALLDRGEG
jgi:RNA 2',3'-cyclic 3'-phosphodiesterase